MKKQHFIRSTRSVVSFFRLPNLLLIVLLSWVIRFRFLQSVFQPVGIEFTLSDVQFWFLVLDLVIVTLIGYGSMIGTIEKSTVLIGQIDF